MANSLNSRSALGEGGDAQRARLTQAGSLAEDANQVGDIESDVTGADRFSHLPKPILHHIMTFLPLDDATRISALSKHFFSVWKSFPVVEFDFFMFVDNHPEYVGLNDFVDYVMASLQSRELSTDLERLTVKAFFEENRMDQARALMETAATFALENKVKELVAKFGEESAFAPGLPNTVFESNAIQRLNLYGLDLSERNLVLQCPLMENLSIANSSAVNTTIAVSCPKLKTVKIDTLKGVTKFELMDENAANVEFFFYNGGRGGRQCQIVNLGSCKSLKTLVLQRVDVDDELFEKEVSQLVLLETLKLSLCRLLRNIKIRNNHLEAAEVDCCEKLAKVEVVAPNLNRFSYSARSWYGAICSDLDLRKCLNMRVLALKGAAGFVTDEWIAKNVSRFKLLEKLAMERCNSIKTLSLYYLRNLRDLKLINCDQLQNFEIHAPNLVSFVYEGDVLPSPPTSVLSAKLHAELRLSQNLRIIDQHKELRDFLSFFGHCKTLTLVFLRETPFVYNLAMRLKMISPLYDLKHLIIKASSFRVAPTPEMVETLLWFAPHPKTICIQLDQKPFLTLKIAEINAEDDQLPCCVSSPVKCWRHYLSSVEIESSSEFKERESLESFLVYNANNAITITDAKNIQID